MNEIMILRLIIFLMIVLWVGLAVCVWVINDRLYKVASVLVAHIKDTEDDGK